jgi:squalene/oxidosqualene cyclase-like protein
MGRDLGSWLLHYVTQNVGVQGYDPVLGAFSPPLRLRVHLAAVAFLWAMLLYVWPVFGIPDVCGPWRLTISVWQAALVTIATYRFGLYVIHTVMPGVSDPGGPRPHKIQRQPVWKDCLHHLPSETTWTYLTAQDSHRRSAERFAGTGAALTGEPSGRDVWSEQPLSKSQVGANTKNRIDESAVQGMAWGGRQPGFNPAVNPNSCDAPHRAQLIREYIASGKSPPSNQPAKDLDEAIRKATHFYSMLQTSDGHFSGDYGGPHFLMPGLIVVWYVMGQPSLMLNPAQTALMKHYLIVHQQADGGWGTHVESPSTMFGTTLSYVALRLLGMDAEEPVCQRGRAFIREQGGAVMTSSWAKLYLCILGCMEWDGHNSVPPELWLLPNWFPFHPSRMWCHARMVYLPMGYVYGVRLKYDKAEEDPLVQALRRELYCEPYDSIEWMQTRHMVAPMDNYSPVAWMMKTVQNGLARYETWPMLQPFKNYVRKLGLAFCVDYMAAEDLQTNFINIGPVNKVLNMLSAFHHAGNDLHHSTVMNHMIRVQDYLWVAEDGMKMKGYNGSQCWDTSFAIQAVFEAGLLDDFPELSNKVWTYLERCQILSTEVSQASPAFKYEAALYRRKFYRHISEGGWPFSTSAHGWPISDCTGEGLKGVLCMLKAKSVREGLEDGSLREISEVRLQKAANILLSYQNEDGGFPTYENNRGFGFYESLNPSEVFGDIMIDYSYVECSMASLTALADFHEDYPDHRTEEIVHAIEKGRDFLKDLQREDGSWYGSWACCFCYGSWFGIEGLVKCGEPVSSEFIAKACKFLLQHQRSNGGWGEDFTSCYDKEYAANGMEAYGDDGSGVVNTSWALMALSTAKCNDIEAIKRGVQYLMKRQLPCGDWPQEGVAGVFNRACGITYTAYRNIFPIWALGRCRAVYGSDLDK